MPRVWVSFGAQVDDPVIRMRLFNQLSVASIAQALTEEAERRAREGEGNGKAEDSSKQVRRVVGGAGSTGHRGLAINRRFNDADAALMRWLGFEFAEDDVRELVEGIRHNTDDSLGWTLKQLEGEDFLSWPDTDSDSPVQSVQVDWRRADWDGCRALFRGQDP